MTTASPSVADTWAAREVSVFLGALFYGIALLQTWLYFFWYPKDKWKLKCIVLLLLVAETFHIILVFWTSYATLIDHFGDFAELDVILWQTTAIDFTSFFSAFIFQLYFARVVYKLAGDWRVKTVVGFIVALSLLSFGTAIWITVIAGKAKSFAKLGFPYDRRVTTVQTISALMCDALITVCLCFAFGKRKAHLTGYMTSELRLGANNMLHILIINAVNRGFLVAVCVALNLGLFLGFPRKLYYIVPQELSGKLYMNNLLATLNSRQYVRRIADKEQSEFYTSVLMTTTCPEQDAGKIEFRIEAVSAEDQNLKTISSGT